MTEATEIVVIGAGPSGVGAAIKLQEEGFDDFVVLERESEVGGTWRDQIYPGLTVDIPVLTYSYSFEQKPDWSSMWAPQPELLEYMRECTDKHHLSSRIRFGQEVVDTTYDESRNLWVTRTADGSELTSRYVINASGYLNVAKWPDIPGIDRFEGKKVHTSAWSEDLDLEGDRIALIGTGATGIQLAPELAPIAEQLSVFQRTAIWLLPKPRLRVPRALQAIFRYVPGAQNAMRFLVAAFMDLVFWRAFTNYRQVKPMGMLVERIAKWHIRKQVHDPETAEKLIPRYSWGCKRPSFSSVFYPTFNRDNVELVTEPIKEITPTGIVTEDGTEREIDALICATGFRPFEKVALPMYPVHGRDGVDLGTYWDENRYQAYRGFAVHGFPNFFLIFGPYSIASTSYFAMIELQVRNIIRTLQAARNRDANYVEVELEAQEEEFERLQGKKKSSVWATANCAGSNTFYVDRFGDTPLFRPTYHPGEWWAARTTAGKGFHFEHRDGEVTDSPKRAEAIA